MYMITEDPIAGTMSITSETDSFTFPRLDGGFLVEMLDAEFPACPDCDRRDRPCCCEDDAEDEAPLDGTEQGEHVVALVERIGRMTGEEIERVAAAWDAARVAAWGAAWAASRGAAWDASRAAAWAASRAASRVAARDAAWVASRAAARVAVTALIVRDLLMTSAQGRRHYDVLTRPLRLAGITVHPDDPAVTE